MFLRSHSPETAGKISSILSPSTCILNNIVDAMLLQLSGKALRNIIDIMLSGSLTPFSANRFTETIMELYSTAGFWSAENLKRMSLWNSVKIPAAPGVSYFLTSSCQVSHAVFLINTDIVDDNFSANNPSTLLLSSFHSLNPSANSLVSWTLVVAGSTISPSSSTTAVFVTCTVLYFLGMSALSITYQYPLALR